jgi:2-keto-4-pentenoate hydratase
VAPDIAQQLWSARHGGRTVSADALGAISDHAAAYTLQTAVTTLSGAVVVGWKLGATSTASQKAFDLSGPFYGPLLAPFCYAAGATVTGAAAFGPGAEGEFALTMAGGLPPRDAPYTVEDVAEAVASVCPALEIAGTRLTGGLMKADPRHLIADDAANIAFIPGEPVKDWRAIDLAAHKIILMINGEEKAAGTGALAFGGPLTALTWFANTLREQGRGLTAGEIITTGTCTGFVPLDPGDEVVVDCGPLGQVSATVA